MKDFNEIIQHLKNEYEKNPNVKAMLITGSVARGEAVHGNDLDILLVTSGEKISKEYYEGNSLVEIGTILLPEGLEKIEKNPMRVYMFLDAKAIFDKENCLQTLQQKAHEVFDSYKSSQEDKSKSKKWLSSVVDKINASKSNGDMLKIGFQVSNVLWPLVEGLYLINNTITPASTSAFRRIKTLKNIPPDFETLWTKMLLGNLEDRTTATLKLIEFVLSKLS
ncbi:MAG TPA: nucleotidyltransferase domain-containing protein [Candidatus Saccharimonadales bacterium]|nr:nucleotidyltransferase domain-containing protein [Candidatus Saccharimonadales bacterium]